MQAKLAKKKDVVVVSLSGKIDVENAEPFRKACIDQLSRQGEKVVFNLNGLSFVGSNGIMPFVRTLDEFKKSTNLELKFCQVGSEFKKIFAASPLAELEIFESVEMAVESFQPQPLQPVSGDEGNSL